MSFHFTFWAKFISNAVLEKFLAKIQCFLFYFLHETAFFYFCKGECHFDVKETKYWGYLYLIILYQCYLEEILKLIMGTTNINIQGFILKT